MACKPWDAKTENEWKLKQWGKLYRIIEWNNRQIKLSKTNFAIPSLPATFVQLNICHLMNDSRAISPWNKHDLATVMERIDCQFDERHRLLNSNLYIRITKKGQKLCGPRNPIFVLNMNNGENQQPISEITSVEKENSENYSISKTHAIFPSLRVSYHFSEIKFYALTDDEDDCSSLKWSI